MSCLPWIFLVIFLCTVFAISLCISSPSSSFPPPSPCDLCYFLFFLFSSPLPLVFPDSFFATTYFLSLIWSIPLFFLAPIYFSSSFMLVSSAASSPSSFVSFSPSLSSCNASSASVSSWVGYRHSHSGSACVFSNRYLHLLETLPTWRLTLRVLNKVQKRRNEVDFFLLSVSPTLTFCLVLFL